MHVLIVECEFSAVGQDIEGSESACKPKPREISTRERLNQTENCIKTRTRQEDMNKLNGTRAREREHSQIQ